MSVSTVMHHRWNDITAEQLTPAVSRRYLTGERVTIARFELKGGGVVPRHSHENEQVSYIVSGALRLPRWARLRGHQMESLAAQVASPPKSVPPP